MKKIYILLVLFVLTGFQTIPASDSAKSKVKSKVTSEHKGTAAKPAMTQLTRVVPEDGAWNDFFGVSAALWGDTAVVGAHRDDDSRGAAYIFKKDEGGSENWGQTTRLIADDRAADHRFGYSVAVSNNAIIVGAPAYPQGSSLVGTSGKYYAQGAVYIFMDETGADNWQQLDMCTTTTIDPGDDEVCPLRILMDAGDYKNIQFGYSLALWGDTLLVGAPGYDGAGGVYIFNRSEKDETEAWKQTKLRTGSGGKFGAAVALSGDTAVVGAPELDAVYVFYRDRGGAGNWGLVKTFYGEASGDNFGYSVALWGDRAIVGAPNHDNGGAAYVHHRDQGGDDNWGRVTSSLAGGGTTDGKFGFSVSIWESIAVVGAWGENSLAGAAYVFLEDWGGDKNWGRVDALTADDAETGDLFGYSVAISGDTAMVGAPRGDGIEGDSGVAYAFGNPGITVKQENTTISNGGTYDFGSQLAYAVTDVTFTIQNDGKTPLTVTTPITLDNIYEFQVQEQPTSPIEAGGTSTFIVRFSAADTGVKTASLSIENSDYYRDPFNIAFTGTVVQPGIDVQGIDDFGSAAINGTGVSGEYTIKNNGTASLNLTGSPTVFLTGDHASDFTVTVLPDVSEIDSGGSTTFTVIFKPGDVGERTAVIRIPNDDPDNNPYDFDILGTGTVGLPSVTTAVVDVLSASAASCGGNVVSDGGSAVTLRGVCWGTAENPTYPASDYTEDDDGTGEFSSSITGLTAGTLYYVRAYAKNSEGTAYGDDISFTSGGSGGNTLADVQTAAVSDITGTSAVGGGNISDDGGAEVTARGVCWSTSSNPTVSDDLTVDGSGTGEFNSGIAGLTEGTAYYVRAYATNSEGTAYGIEMSFTAGDPIISGTVTEDGEPLPDVTLTFSNVDGAGTPGETTSDFNGEYSATVPGDDPFPDGWTGTVTPSEAGYTFTPESKSYTGVTSDRLMQNFEGTGTGSGVPEISVNFTQLIYTAINSGAQTGPQQLLVTNAGGGTLNWTTVLSSDWISISPAAGTGDGFIAVSVDSTGFTTGDNIGTITIIDPGAVNSPVKVTVYVNVVDSGEDSPPLGGFDTPVEGSVVSGGVPVTGWAVDDVEVTGVKIYRAPVSGEGDGRVYIGDGDFVTGARPDIETAYPGYPRNYQAGWGYMLLTHFLPGGGNGVYTLYAAASDGAGHEVILGSKTVTCDNAGSVKPFGAIDTPGQGGEASGTAFVNWGWALTPQPNFIPADGSTISVYVDGKALGSPGYNVYREDVAGLFPGYANSNGAAGHFSLDTTAFATGVHTISWAVTDGAGNAEGIGSRYFTMINPGVSGRTVSRAAFGREGTAAGGSGYLSVRSGWGRDRGPRVVTPGKGGGTFYIESRELEPVEVVPAPGTVYRGAAVVVAGGYRGLPPGAVLDSRTGTFRWMPGPGFVGAYTFILTGARADGQVVMDRIAITIKPKYN